MNIKLHWCAATLIFFISCFVHVSFADAQSRQDWRVYGGDSEATHYSSLQQINRSNVSRLKVAWQFDAGDAYQGSEMECNPIIVDGLLYATSPKGDVVALDAATGELRWRFSPLGDKKVIGKIRNRGVTYWRDGGDQRIFSSAYQYLYALDAKTGKLIQRFGNSGRIDLRENLGRDGSDMVALSSPGIIYRDLLIVGSAVSEMLPAPPGDIRAYDVRSGKLRWSFHTIPHPGEFGYETWPKDAWKYSGAANNWSGMSLDKKRGLVFVPTGSTAYDFYGANRLGDNLFANSLIALDANSGKRIWHFQTVKHDLWDRDLPAPPTLVTLHNGEKSVDAVAQITKSGYIYLFNRIDGKSLFPIEYRKAPSSELDGEKAAQEQPLPLGIEPFARQQLSADDLTRRTPEAHAAALEKFSQLRKGWFEPPSEQGTLLFPGFDGGGEWGGAAFDPETQRLYINANEIANIVRMNKASSELLSGKALYLQACAGCHGADRKGSPPEFPSLENIGTRHTDLEIGTLIYTGSGRMPAFARLGLDRIGAIFQYVVHDVDTAVAGKGASLETMPYSNDGYAKFLDPDGYPATTPPWGTLNAIDLNTGKIAWKIPLGEYPELVAQGLKNTGSESYGGPIATAGGLLFIAATSYDKKIRAFDKDTGNLLWEAELPAAGNATPATYMIQGKQYVVIAAGGGKSPAASRAVLIAFALPD